jgi:hypothetical protein
MAQPQPPAIDPNVAAIVQQHQQQLNLIQQQQQQQQQQHQNVQQRQQQRERRDRQRDWVSDEKEKIELCDGNVTKALRKWLRAINGSIPRLPAVLQPHADDAIKALIKKTIIGDLDEEYETFLNNAPNRAGVTHQAVVQHLRDAFLGPDEGATLRDDLKTLKQQAREQIPTYNRRYKMDADYAYPLPRAAMDEETLADMYMGSLKEGKVKDKVFGADPRLVTLHDSQRVAAEEWARQRRRARVQREVRGQHEPMEVDVAEEERLFHQEEAAVNEPPLREIIPALAKGIRDLQDEFKRLNSPQNVWRDINGKSKRSPLHCLFVCL